MWKLGDVRQLPQPFDSTILSAELSYHRREDSSERTCRVLAVVFHIGQLGLVSTFSFSLFRTRGQRPWIRDTPYANVYDTPETRYRSYVVSLVPLIAPFLSLSHAHPRILHSLSLSKGETNVAPLQPPLLPVAPACAPHLYFYCHNQFN